MKHLTIVLILLLSLQACIEKPKKATARQADTDTKALADTLDNPYKETNDEPAQNAWGFPKMGRKASDFIASPDRFEIQHEAKGDLNGDGLEDMVLVQKEKGSKTAQRPMLVLLRNADKTYRLDKVSELIMPQEYNEYDFKMYADERISIDSGKLKIELYGSGGPMGNTFSYFKYSGNDLVLTYLETYNAGAGSWQSIYYNLEKGTLTEVMTNTLKEGMPAESQTFKVKKHRHLFENTLPDEVLQNAFQK